MRLPREGSPLVENAFQGLGCYLDLKTVPRMELPLLCPGGKENSFPVDKILYCCHVVHDEGYAYLQGKGLMLREELWDQEFSCDVELLDLLFSQNSIYLTQGEVTSTFFLGVCPDFDRRKKGKPTGVFLWLRTT